MNEGDSHAVAQGSVRRDGTEGLQAGVRKSGAGWVVTVREGKYHQVRRMLGSRGKPVT